MTFVCCSNKFVILFVSAISESTGMDPHDIAATLQQLNFVQLKKQR